MSDLVTIDEEFMRRKRQKMEVTYADPYNGLEWTLVVFIFLLAGGIIAWIYKKIGKGK